MHHVVGVVSILKKQLIFSIIPFFLFLSKSLTVFASSFFFLFILINYRLVCNNNHHNDGTKIEKQLKIDLFDEIMVYKIYTFMFYIVIRYIQIVYGANFYNNNEV